MNKQLWKEQEEIFTINNTKCSLSVYYFTGKIKHESLYFFIQVKLAKKRIYIDTVKLLQIDKYGGLSIFFRILKTDVELITGLLIRYHLPLLTNLCCDDLSTFII